MNINASTGLMWVSIVWFTGMAPSLGAGLKGKYRQDFVAAIFASCYKAEDAAKQGFDLEMVAQYCGCYSNAVADLLTQEQAEELDKSDVPATVIRPTAEVAAKKCLRR